MGRTARPGLRLLALLALGLGQTMGLTACDRQENDPQAQGAAERAGAQIDQAIDRTGEELNKIAEKAGEQMQAFGRRLEQEAQEAQQERDQQAADAGGAPTSGGQ